MSIFNPFPISRRKFFRRALQTGAATTGAIGLATGYGFWEASQIRIRRMTIAVPNLPQGFSGKTVAILTDMHHGPYVSLKFIREAVSIANDLKPDLFALLGDFGDRKANPEIDLAPCLEAMSSLRAPLGVFAVPGNHDMHNDGDTYSEMVASTPLNDLTNKHFRITHNSEHLWLAGVDDMWWGKPDLPTALRGVPEGAAIVLLSHNPDFAEIAPDDRLGLILSGHMHGGQIYLPGFGAPWVPSRFGQKYVKGLVRGPASQVYISRGLGEAGIPLRINVPPEINVLTLI